MVIDSNKTVGNIVADDYRTAGVFSQLGIDFCCKGNRTIDEVCAKKGIDKYALLDELERVTANNNNQGIDFKSWELDLLIDYIEKKHHRYVEEKIPQLLSFLLKLEQVHGAQHPELFEIKKLFKRSADELTQHMKKEELILFPFIKKMVEANRNNTPINNPGFGSVAKYVAVSTFEASLDVASMAASSTKVFILEVMGRHTGWIAAAGALAQPYAQGAPHLILFPEVPFQQADFLQKVQQTVAQKGYCVIVVSEGVAHPDGRFLAESGLRDAFGHAQLGGVAPYLAGLIKSELNLKNHWAVADYLQRAARHIASQNDVDQAYALGKSAVELAISGKNAVMPIVVRDSSSPYRWHIEDVALSKVANVEKKVPREFISEDGYGITAACREYLEPLIAGEAYPPYHNGLPQYIQLSLQTVAKKLKEAAIS